MACFPLMKSFSWASVLRSTNATLRDTIHCRKPHKREAASTSVPHDVSRRLCLESHWKQLRLKGIFEPRLQYQDTIKRQQARAQIPLNLLSTCLRQVQFSGIRRSAQHTDTNNAIVGRLLLPKKTSMRCIVSAWPHHHWCEKTGESISGIAKQPRNGRAW